ncbi:AMP-binding protein, partial [Streptomyces sp. NPDC056683]|uniref:AMP-binding protein n=1 Tax=Streptomyces sp. NPDC056683 TaxID=3345910 RepID=UPI0036A6D15E
MIPVGASEITPEMLPLVELTAEQIERIVEAVEGGAANVQDVYPLAPLQEGVFFHHLMQAGRGDATDVYIMPIALGFDSRDRLDQFLGALQQVVDRHDIYRTAIVWDGLREPVQVVARRVQLPVEEIILDPHGADPVAQLRAAAGGWLDLGRAPLLDVHIAAAPTGDEWLALLRIHHLVRDDTTTDALFAEVRAVLAGRAASLQEPLPFRDFVAQARLGTPRAEHERYFAELLGDVTETTAPFGLTEAHGDGAGVVHAHSLIDGELALRIRQSARRLGVSPATVCHLAWARVLAAVSGRDDVVFGTVLFGRMNSGAGPDRVQGPFINTLPLRVRTGAGSVTEALSGMRQQLAELMAHEHAPLVLAQQASGVPGGSPLFTALFNYRHAQGGTPQVGAGLGPGLEGLRFLFSEGRTNYPLVAGVDDDGEQFQLSVDATAPADAEQVCALLRTCLDNLVTALEDDPQSRLDAVGVLDETEVARLLEQWNDTARAVPNGTLPGLIEAQVARTPDALAVVFEGVEITFADLDARANRLARHLLALGVRPESVVAVAMERSVELVVALLAVLKAGGAYLPIDTGHPAERIAHLLADGGPAAVLTSADSAPALPGAAGVPVVVLDDPASGAELATLDGAPVTDAERGGALLPTHPAYLIFTSGSTGRPKGVVVAHEGVVNRLAWMQEVY